MPNAEMYGFMFDEAQVLVWQFVMCSRYVVLRWTIVVSPGRLDC